MITRSQIQALMPPAAMKDHIDYPVVVNRNIIKTIHKNMDRAVDVTKYAAPVFKGATIEDTCRNVWNFLKTQIRYVKDDPEDQKVRMPNRFLIDGEGDCKSYSLFAGAILKNLGIDEVFRYTSYDWDPTPRHVYVVALDGTITPRGTSGVVITDGVWRSFNSQKPFTFKQDYMPIKTLSGTAEDQAYLARQQALANRPMGDIGKINVGKAIKKVTTAVKKDVKKVVAADKKIVQKAGKGVITVAKKGADVLKKIPGAAKMILGAPERRAFRTLVAINFHNYANKLAADPKTYEVWAKLGGNRSELQQSINAGTKRRAILGIGCMDCQVGSRNEIGVVVAATVASIIAAATPVIIALTNILKETLGTINAAKQKAGNQEMTADPDAGNMPPAPDAPPPAGQPSMPFPGLFVQDGTIPTGAQVAVPQQQTSQPQQTNSQQGQNAMGPPYYPDYGTDTGADQQTDTSGQQKNTTQDTQTKTSKSSAAPLVLAALAAKLLFF